MGKLECAVIEDKNHPGDWRVESINFADEGSVCLTIFSGPSAKERAEDYARAVHS